MNVKNYFQWRAGIIALALFVAQSSFAQTPNGQDFVAKAEEYMKAAVAVNGFSGSVLVAKDGMPVFNKGYGMANVELDVPNAPDTVFRLGSITKQFTSMAIMMLVERGKLNVSDPICKHIPECPAAWQPVTIKHLLTHTGGVPNYTSFPDFAKTAALPTTNDEMIARVKDKPLDFAPGEKYAYSNSGYFLLGIIIERVSGKNYAEFLRENIFGPLGMKHTGYDVSSQIIKHRAAGYARRAGETINAAYMDMTLPGAAGALYSTTGDLLIWSQALATDKLVSRRSLDEIFTPVKNGYGYGWNIGKRFDRDVITHGGGIFGFATSIARYPADKVTVVVLSNVEGGPAGRVANDLAAINFGAPYQIPKERKEISLAANMLEKYVGQYELSAPKAVISITLENGRLFGSLAGQSKFALSAESETVFFSRDLPVQFEFTKDASGQITGLSFSQGGGKIPAQKLK